MTDKSRSACKDERDCEDDESRLQVSPFQRHHVIEGIRRVIVSPVADITRGEQEITHRRNRLDYQVDPYQFRSSALLKPYRVVKPPSVPLRYNFGPFDSRHVYQNKDRRHYYPENVNSYLCGSGYFPVHCGPVEYPDEYRGGNNSHHEELSERVDPHGPGMTPDDILKRARDTIYTEKEKRYKNPPVSQLAQNQASHAADPLHLKGHEKIDESCGGRKQNIDEKNQYHLRFLFLRFLFFPPG